MTDITDKEQTPAVQHIIDAISGIKYGAVEVLIHDSRIVQVERTEKTRFDLPAR